MRVFFMLALVMFLSHFAYSGSNQSKSVKKNQINEIEQEFKKMEEMFDRVFNDQFFRGKNDPFSDMRNFRNEMRKMLNILPQNIKGNEFDSLFKSWFGNRFGGDLNDITITEDDNNVYCKIKILDLINQEIDISIKNELVTIKSKYNEKNISKNKKGISRSHKQQSFTRNFSVPSNADSTKMRTSIKGDFLTIKFPKIERKEYRKKIKIKDGVSI